MTDQPVRNLVIVHMPQHQALADWQAVKEKIEARAADIEVRIADNTAPNSATRRWQTRRPSLVFSPSPLLEFKPAGGKIYQGARLNKLDQFEALAAAGVPTPDSALLRAGIKLDPDRWGEFAVIKPTGRWSSYGRFVRLVRTETIAARYGELTDNGAVETMVQKYVDLTDDLGRVNETRVLTIFGRPLYALKATEASPRPPLDETADADGLIAINRRGIERELRLEATDEILDLARRAAAVAPDVPCLGVDVARDRGSGELQVLETNGASVWHLSSRSTPNYPPEVREGIYTQFDALETAAEALIERTRAEAA